MAGWAAALSHSVGTERPLTIRLDQSGSYTVSSTR
jgi:hypothetical protein